MYTWGYVKEAALAKLDLTEREAQAQNLLSRFVFYANEVITQVTSSIKPKETYFTFVANAGDVFEMPNDFVSFGSNINTVTDDYTHEATPDNYRFLGYNQILCLTKGVFNISYNARWFTFTSMLDNNTIINIPADIIECIPSYIAHQCYKIDDEVKSAIFRNEYELFLSRIDNTATASNSTIHVGGDW